VYTCRSTNMKCVNSFILCRKRIYLLP